MPSTKPVQWLAVKHNLGPSRFLLSRTRTSGKLPATSTQLPDEPERLLFFHSARDTSMPTSSYAASS